MVKLHCSVWRDNPAMLKQERLILYDTRQLTGFKTEDQAPVRGAPCDTLSRRPHFVPAHGWCNEHQAFHGEDDWWAEGPCEQAFGSIVTHRSWFSMSYNFRELFGFSSLVFDCLTTCNVFILSKMEGTDCYSLKGEKKATEKLSELINTVKIVKRSTRTNLLTISPCLACRSISVCKEEAWELEAPSCRTWADHSSESCHCSLSLLISMMPFQHTLWESL